MDGPARARLFARSVLGVDAVLLLAFGLAGMAWAGWLFFDGVRGGPDGEQGFMELFLVVAGPLMALSAAALGALGLLVGRVTLRSTGEELGRALLGLLVAFGVAGTIGAFSSEHGWKVRPSLGWLAVGLVHLGAAAAAFRSRTRSPGGSAAPDP